MSKFTARIESNRWTPADEEALLETWGQEEIYAFDPRAKNLYSVDTPPPYLSGHVHIGQLVHYTQIDIIARYRRMQGLQVNFPLGIDRNGLPVELRVEKEFGMNMHNTPREEFVRKCKEQLDMYEEEVVESFRRLGISFNAYSGDGVYRTDSPKYRAVTQATFISLWKQGLVYSDYRPNNWCLDCGTTIADAEVEYEERQTTLYYLYFQVERMEPIKIATTRPELLCACGAIFVHPDDERYREYRGKKARVPIFDIDVPIIESATAQVEFGTGALMVCSYGDMADVMAFRNFGLKPIPAISPEGRMTDAAGKYAGLSTSEAKKKIVEDLRARGILYKEESINQRVPICWRSKTPIEFIAMDEYYLRQTEFTDALMKIALETKFFPDFHRQILIDWINRVSVDWPVSRRRFYGTEMPIWYCNACGKPVLPEPGEVRYYQPWREDPPFNKCPECGAENGFKGEERTFDTWMDSSISGLQIIGYMRNDALFRKGFGNVIRPQGKDIVRTWLYYSLLRTYQLTKKAAFKEVWVSGHVVDDKGEKMSKSKGNSPPPKPIIDKYGADAMRLFGILEAGLGSDVRFSEDRLAGVSKFMTKLWNISRFLSMFPIPPRMQYSDLTAVDRWILAETNKMIEGIIPDCELLDFHKPATDVKSFAWGFFADHIVEMLKARCLNTDGSFTAEEQQSGWYALHETLKVILKALAPITPFITDRVYRELYNKRGIHREQFPSVNAEWQSPLTKETNLVLQTDAALWKFKRDSNMSLRQGIPEACIPGRLKSWAKDLKAMHGIQTLRFTKPKGTGFTQVPIPESDEFIYVKGAQTAESSK